MSANLPTVRQTTGLAIQGGPTVLGERQVRIPTAGKVRPGIKRLTQRAANNADAKKAYAAGVAAGKDWSAIEKDVRRALGDTKNAEGRDPPSPLTPQNVPYFTVRRSDFTMPEIADQIMAEYGEDRGEGRHLYRFPVVLPVDNWQAVLPHALKAYRRTEIVYWSEYGPDGVRYCKMLAPLVKDEQSKRFVRPWGGRGTTYRPDVEGGRCEPEFCPQYQASPQQCKLSGSFIFYIPKVLGAGAIELPMTSFYGLQGIRQQLELMAHIRGRISGTYNGQPMFWLTKREEEVSMLDLESGTPKRVKQWITVLEGAVDMTQVLTAPEDDHDDIVVQATAVLEGPGNHAEPETGFVHDIPGEDDVDVETGEVLARSAPTTISQAPPSKEEMQAAIRHRVTRGLLVQWADFKEYALHKWKDGWQDDITRLASIRDEVESVDDTDDGRAFYQQKVKDEVPF